MTISNFTAFDKKGKSFLIEKHKTPYRFGTFPKLHDEDGNEILMGDIELFEKGLVVTRVETLDKKNDTIDWHPLDTSHAKEWAAETAHCHDVLEVNFFHAGKKRIFKNPNNKIVKTINLNSNHVANLEKIKILSAAYPINYFDWNVGQRVGIKEAWCHDNYPFAYPDENSIFFYRADYVNQNGDDTEERKWLSAASLPKHGIRFVLTVAEVDQKKITELTHDCVRHKGLMPLFDDECVCLTLKLQET